MWWKNRFCITETPLRVALQAERVTPAHGDRFFLLLLFFYFESSAAENDVITMQASCSHLTLPVIIALIGGLTDCDSFIPRRLLQAEMGLTFHSQSFPPELSSSQSHGRCQSLEMTPISPICSCTCARWNTHVSACTKSRICVQPETVTARRCSKLGWRRRKDNDRDAAETFPSEEVDGKGNGP